MRFNHDKIPVVPEFIGEYIENHYGDILPSSWYRADLLRDLDNYISVSKRDNVKTWLNNSDNYLAFVMAVASDNYLVELKKYYWRKKDEYLAHFENKYINYLNVNVNANETIYLGSRLDAHGYNTKFTEEEARKILKDDFDKFERVEIE